jgi:broad specificity phosphatase PhoE
MLIAYKGKQMRIFLIRHAQSFNNLVGPSERTHEPWITELGFKQVESLGRYLAARLNPHAARLRSDFANQRGYYFTRLFTSPMYRSLQTAQYLADSLRLIPEVWADIHEDGGIWLEGSPRFLSGMSSKEIMQLFPHCILDKRITENGWWNREKEGEDEAYGRALRVAQQLMLHSKSNEQIILVTHSGFLDKLIKALLRQPPTNEILHITQNTSITRLDFIEGQIRFCYLNKTDHLNKELDSE